ncbi:MAG: diflavin oxidoreductase [Hyphomicrobiaceae bacterium]
MTGANIIPNTAPFTPQEIDALNVLVSKATPMQRAWLAGFLSGLDAKEGLGGAAGATASAPPRAKVPLTIIYASESGNAESLARKAKKLAGKQGFDAKVYDMGDTDVDVLAKAKNIVAYIATWGEGDPPERAQDFYDGLMGDAAPKLDGVNFAVLGLGDTAYVNFCQTAQEIDARFEALGGKRANDRVDLDLDFSKQAAAWTDKTITSLKPADAVADASTIVHVDFTTSEDDDDEPRYTADNPLETEISEMVNLNGTGSTHETWHVEIAIDDPAFTYQPGDAIGIIPENDPQLAIDLLDATGLGGNDALAQRLTTSYDITTLSRPVIKAYAELTGREDVGELDDAEAFAKFSDDRQLIDLFVEHKEKLTEDQLTGLLRPLPGRLYSVASSQRAHDGEAHLLVGAVRWDAHGRKRGGVASTYLADRCKAGDNVKVYVKPNRHFRLPTDDNTPIIMIGAGTGVAPYRGFLAERAEREAAGKSWLFFGERNYTSDFLYQLEWQEFKEDGFLTNISAAFSRDQPEKIYVQDKLWAHRDAVQGWIDDGAHIYVCGDEKGMAKDVDLTLAKIVGAGDEEAGRVKLKELSKAHRYQRDVY